MGLTQEELAQKTGVSTMSIRRYESGERMPAIISLSVIAKALEISLETLIPDYNGFVTSKGYPSTSNQVKLVNDYEKEIALRVKSARNKKGFTQAQLAEKVFESESLIADYENGLIDINLALLEKIAKELDTTTDNLLGLNLKALYNIPLQKYIDIWSKALSTAEENAELVKESELFLEIYNKYLNNRGKKKIHEYAEDIITNQKNLKAGVKPLAKDSPPQDK